MLETIVSDTEEDDQSNASNEMNANDGNYEFENRGFEAQLEFLEDEYYSNIDDDDDDDMDEDGLMDMDVDELTYEELIALGEFIGVEKRGLSLNEVSSYLDLYSYKIAENKIGVDRCVICQIEYEDGEELVTIKKACEHPYHSECIKKWLQIKKCCPICSTEVSSPP